VAPSDDFLALFPRISVRSGGVRSGFRHVATEEEDTDQKQTLTLLRVFKNPAAGANGVIVVEVEPVWRSLDDADVFVLDEGDKIWMWQGKDCSPMEKGKAAQVVHDMTIAKHAEVEVLSQTESRSRRVVDLLGGDDETPRAGFRCRRPLASGNQPRGRGGEDEDAGADRGANRRKRLFRLSDATGELAFDLVKEGERITRDDLDSNDVFVLDDYGRALWVWEGSGASATERKWWYRIVQSYLRWLEGQGGNEEAYLMPVGKVVEGSESRTFLKVVAV
jgi:gelsolin